MSAGRGWMLPDPDPSAPLRLFCFHHAGAGASAFRPWIAPLGAAGVAVCAVQLPGRENRFLEPAHTRLAPLLEALLPQLEPHLRRPYALFGHSMGALVAFAAARALRAAGAPGPARLHVSGRIAPQLSDPRGRLHDLPDEDLLAELRVLGGVPAAVLDNRELMALQLPLLRADLAVNETYRHVAEAPLDVPITAFGGIDDPKVDEHELRGWARQTRAGFRLCLLPGGHFFVATALSLLLRDLVTDLPLAA
jgi:medium-chain acyl-[acyl-carrier-protein] hydrolase